MRKCPKCGSRRVAPILYGMPAFSEEMEQQKKETARASMRKMVKRLLKKYKYPPEDYEMAIDTVISQCEMWTDNMDEISA